MTKKLLRILLLLVCVTIAVSVLHAQQASTNQTYQQLHECVLSRERIPVNALSMKKGQIHLEWTGNFYPEVPISGKIYGLVFIGEGRIRLDPDSDFEKERLQQFLKSDHVDLTFSNAVLRFTDDTYESLVRAGHEKGVTTLEPQKLANEVEPRLLRETGFNVSARLLGAILNNDQPGVFFAEFSGAKQGRFDALLDYQTRSLQTAFELNAGERGLLFQHNGVLTGTDIWTVLADDRQASGRTSSDDSSLITIPNYRMRVDLRDAPHWININAEIEMTALRDEVRLVPMDLNEGLGEIDDARRKKGLRVTSASLDDGTAVQVIQDEWDKSVSLVLPKPLNKNQTSTIRLVLQGEHSFFTWEGAFHYPLSTETWYPRYGYLSRSRFDVTFLHKKNTLVASNGERVTERPDGDGMLTEWKTPDPTTLISFAVGLFERHSQTISINGKNIAIEFYSVPSRYGAVKEDFVLAELSNGLNFFSQLFGDYPYSRLGAVYFPSNFGQGFPTLILLPEEGSASLRHFSFISHEISHQWWGDVVAWQSYRDQWLSEGFAEYSSALYASRRDNPKRALDLVRDMRRELQESPTTDTGIARGKLYEVGPLIMGHRLSSRLSGGAYTALVYSKGGLILRMLHFLFSDPSTGNDERFYQMMNDFVSANRYRAASTDSFFLTASKRFAQTPVAQKSGLTDLNWFVRQWVYQSALPSYRLEYTLTPRPQGGTLFAATLYQNDVPEDWIEPLPIVFDFGGGQGARGTICARGPKTTVKIGLPAEPKKVAIDPDLWVLTSKIEVSKVKE